ncbi:MAG: S8 family serine peptidase [Actinomycetota bacterium]
MARGKKTTRKSTAKRTAGKATRRQRRSRVPKLSSGLPRTVYAQASPRSIGGLSLFDAGEIISADYAMNFSSETELVMTAARRLQDAGFEVLQLSPITINIAGPPSLYDRVFGTSLIAEERPVIKEQGLEDTATFVEALDTELPGLVDTSTSELADVLEGVALEEPRYFMQNAFAPNKSYWYLDVPGDVSLGMNADKAHRGAITGKGVKVVMTDSGWYKHPFFTQRGYRASPAVLGPGTANPNDDESGHGTAESANIFAVAPDVDFTMVKLSFVNTIGGFNTAVGLSPNIISNSWGSDQRFGPLSAANQAMAAAIALAVANGIIVVFSAGNGHFGFPGQHPDVISAGGVFMEANGNMRASDYSSGFASSIYSGRNVPDVCGLVGMRPRAAYIMLPLQPGDQIDVGSAGGTHPNGDETATNDGWAAISGTSAAAPQLAGVCALIKQACPKLTPAQVRDVLKKTARDVITGSTHPNTGNTAAVGPDLATGHGLADANKAVLVAKVRCMRTPIRPIGTTPIGPVPITPVPITPITPTPITPTTPITPIPITPIAPITPVGPVILPAPGPTEAGEAEAQTVEEQVGGGALSDEDIEQLEHIITESENDLDL